MSRLENPFFPTRCGDEVAELLIDDAHDRKLKRESDLEMEGRALDREWPDIADDDFVCTMFD